MSVEINHSGVNIKEESTDNENGLDGSCKSNGFLYVDMNDYNENNFNGIDIKEEEEQVEDLLLEKNASENGEIYFEESLPLNSLKNLANHSQNELKVIEIQTINKNVKKRGGFHSKEVQKENISIKTPICSTVGENSESKRYTLRARKWSQKKNMDFLGTVSPKRKNLKARNKTMICSKFDLRHSGDNQVLTSDTEKKDFKCFYCKSSFNSNSIRNAHIKICLQRFKNNEGLNHGNYYVHSGQVMPEENLKDFKGTYYECDKCNRVFRKKINLTSHILKSECKFEEYVCAFCSQTFLQKNILRKHVIAHTKNGSKCRWCFQKFKTFTGLNNHICAEEKKSTNTCCECNGFLKSTSQENQNEDIKNKCSQCRKSADNQSFEVSYPKIFSCQICRKNYKGIISYRKHLKTHKEFSEDGTKEDISISDWVGSSAKGQSSNSGKKKIRYKCDICGKLFIKLVKLKIHILNIHQGVNYQCEKCNVKFLSVEDLETHKTKEGCKPEDLCTCTTCGKVFAKRDYLKKHQYMHMNVLFKCKYCYCAFMKEKSYQKHMEKMNCSKSARKIKMAEFNYKKCRLCEVEYETEELLIEHFRVSHIGLEPHQCFCCDSCLPTFLDLQNHIHQHNIQKYTCNLCGKPYTSQEGFRKHRLKHKGAEFKCKFCESEFLNENRFKFHEKTCKKNPDSSYAPSQKKEKPKKKDSKPKQSRQLHWESRIIMKRLRGDPTQLSGEHKSGTVGQQDGSASSTFFDEPESEVTNERGWFDNYYKTEEDDIAFGLKKADENASQDCNSDLDMSEFLVKGQTKKRKTSSPPSATLNALNSDAAEDHETEAPADDYSQSSETSSTDSEDEVQSADLQIDYNFKKCRLCIISFGQEYELLHHFIKSHPGEFAHQCPHCGVQSPLYAQLREHMKTHGIGIGIFNCDNCSKQFKSEKKMNSHNVRCKGIKSGANVPDKRSVSQSGDVSCKRCGKNFHTKFGYRRHKQLCKKKKIKNSDKVAAGAAKVSASKETGADCSVEANDLPCSDAEEEGLKVTAEEGVAETTTSAFKAKPDCPKPAGTSSPNNKLQGEEKKGEIKSTYSGEPPMDSFPCRLCDKKFQYERGIVMHFKASHPGNKPLICHVCNMQLADKLKEHLKTHGIGEEFVCELCGKRFNQKFLSKIHEMWHEGIEYKCNNCKQKFLNKEKMDKHIGENRCSNRQSLMRLPCDICGKSYRSKFGLSKHYITHTPKELRPVKNRMNCEYCGKWFENNNGLQRHRRIHTGERPFCCRFCPKAFAQEGNCKAHERIHTGESKPRKKKVSAVASPPRLVPPPNPLVALASAVPAFSLPSTVSTVESVSYPGQISLYSYNSVDPSGIVH